MAWRPMVSPFLKFLCHTINRTSLDEWSARRRDLYLITHNTHNRHTSMPPLGFEPTISAAADLRLRPRGHRDRQFSLYSSIYVQTFALFYFVLNTYFKMERILNNCIFSHLRIWDCLPFVTWHHVTGYSVPNVLRQVNGLQSSGDDYTMTQPYISYEWNILCICMQKANCSVQ